MKGWFKIPGLRPEGDRTIAEQSLGLEDALAEARDKSVLDLGCAEGAISKQFAEAGAVLVVGIESLAAHLEIARRWCSGFPQVRFENSYLQDWIPAHEPPEQFDIVLILGIVHKLPDPSIPLDWAARATRDLLLYRGPASGGDGWVKAKHFDANANYREIFEKRGLIFEKRAPGVRGEAVEYWRRKK